MLMFSLWKLTYTSLFNIVINISWHIWIKLNKLNKTLSKLKKFYNQITIQIYQTNQLKNYLNNLTKYYNKNNKKLEYNKIQDIWILKK